MRNEDDYKVSNEHTCYIPNAKKVAIEKLKTIAAIIERPNGTTYEQQVLVKPNETIDEALNKLKRVLGKSYYVCDYYEID